jgi:hypothetical protein
MSLTPSLANFLAKDGSVTPTANISFGGYRLTSLGDATADTDALNRRSGDARYPVNTTGSIQVDGGGNVGIGRASNGSKLDVEGFARFVNPFGSGSTGAIILRDAPGNPGTVFIQVVNNNNTSQYGYIAIDSAYINFSSSIRPISDNSLTIGTASLRWSTIYAATGTINTSDEREKRWRGALTEAELAAARRIASEIGVFQWLESIAEKGADAARLHIGVRAQRCFAILEEYGLDWRRYGWCCHDSWEARPALIAEQDDGIGAGPPALAAGDRHGIRPDQLALFLIAAQEARLMALEEAAG